MMYLHVVVLCFLFSLSVLDLCFYNMHHLENNICIYFLLPFSSTRGLPLHVYLAA